jgi:hypothetical protein
VGVTPPRIKWTISKNDDAERVFDVGTFLGACVPYYRDRPANVSIHPVWEKLEDKDYANLCIPGHYFMTFDRRLFECIQYDVICEPKSKYGDGKWSKYRKILERGLKQRHTQRLRWVDNDLKYWPDNLVKGKAAFTTKGKYTANLHFKKVSKIPPTLCGYHYCWDESPFSVFDGELFTPVLREDPDWVAGCMILNSFNGDQEKLLLCLRNRIIR